MPHITLLLHNIRSTHNVGSIFRTAEGFGVTNIICSGYTPYPEHPGDTRLPHIARKISSQIHKTALGAETMVSFTHVADIDDWLAHNTHPLIALEQTSDSVPLPAYTPPDAYVLLLGEEVEGISDDMIKHCEVALEIPMHGKKESFNVSVAAGIALYQLISAA